MKLKKFLAAANRILELQPNAEVFEDKGQITFGLPLYGRDKSRPFSLEIQAELRALGMKPDCCEHWGFDLNPWENEVESEDEIEPEDDQAHLYKPPYGRTNPCGVCNGRGEILSSSGVPGQIFGDGDAWRSCDDCEGTGEKKGQV